MQFYACEDAVVVRGDDGTGALGEYFAVVAIVEKARDIKGEWVAKSPVFGLCGQGRSRRAALRSLQGVFSSHVACYPGGDEREMTGLRWQDLPLNGTSMVRVCGAMVRLFRAARRLKGEIVVLIISDTARVAADGTRKIRKSRRQARVTS